MIERYFVKGARFSWAAPGANRSQPQDGEIVVTPPVTAPMFYVGLDEEIVDHSLPNVTSLGLRKDMGIPYTWLSYIHGRTAKVQTTRDVLTGFMSGCWITVWTGATGRWVGHVGTIESVAKTAPPNSTVKNTFVQEMPANVRGYKPNEAFDPTEFMPLLAKVSGKPTAKVMSLVTAGDQFYSLLMIERTATEPGVWICAGKQLVDGVGYDDLSRELVTTRPRR